MFKDVQGPDGYIAAKEAIYRENHCSVVPDPHFPPSPFAPGIPAILLPLLSRSGPVVHYPDRISGPKCKFCQETPFSSSSNPSLMSPGQSLSPSQYPQGTMFV